MSAILVVEQDPGYANRIVAALRAAGHDVAMASNREEAESSVASRRFDLVLANGMMPGAGDLLGRFSATAGGPGSVVLLPVTLASHTDAHAYSADGVLSKPFSDEDLERVVSARLIGTKAEIATSAGTPRPAAPQSVAPQSVAPQSAAPQPAAPQSAAPRPAAPRPAHPQPAVGPRPTSARTIGEDVDDLLNKTLSGLDISSLTRKRPRPASAPPAAPQPAAPQPAAPQPPPPQKPKAPTALSSTDIFGDVLAEVEAESARTRSREQATPPTPPQTTAGAAGSQPTTPRPTTPAAPPAAPPPPLAQPPQLPVAGRTDTPVERPAPKRGPYDDDLDRKLEETLSGIMPSRLRRPRPEVPSAPPPEAPAVAEPAPPPTAFAAPRPALANLEPPPAFDPGNLPVDFTEDETVSLVRPAGLVRDSTPASPPSEALDEGELDFFATTRLPTRPAAAKVPSPAVAPEPAAPGPTAPEPAAPGPTAPEPAAPGPTAPEPAPPVSNFDLGDESDDFEISFGEHEPQAADEPGSIWSAYGNEETGGWGTTSFEAQAPVAPTLPSQTPAASESAVPDEPSAVELDVSGWGADPAWDADPDRRSSGETPSVAQTADAETADADFASDSMWEVPAVSEDSGSASVEPSALGTGGAFGELSQELGADDTGSFHTALQGVLQIRGEDSESSSQEDHGIPFGDYRLLERVAVGGMAEVWRARRRGVEGFQKTVAIKRILSHLTGSTDFISMFIDEAKLAAQLNHANIAQIYDLGKVDDDFYIAMEFVEGRDLRTLLREADQKNRPLPLGQALFIIAAVARGLDYAHRKRDFENRDLGLVHRDVSPQNVLVSSEGEIKLCDFGIVKAVAKASTTQMGALKGKLQYMSPEQAWGKDVDGRSDIFSLGTVLFEALTGEKLFTGDSEIGVLDAVRDCRLKAARDIAPAIPESVEGILTKALQPLPEDRYQTAGEFERDLQSVLDTLKPSPGQSDLARYMHRLLETPTAEDDAAIAGSADADDAVEADTDGSAGAWTGTSWGTASFYEVDDAVAASEPVAAAQLPGTAEAPPTAAKPLAREPVSSKPAPPTTPPTRSVREPLSSSISAKVQMPVRPAKKGGGRILWVLIVFTMLAIVAAYLWTQQSGESSPGSSVQTPTVESLPADRADGAATAESGVAEDPAAAAGQTQGEEGTVDQKEVMEQMIQEEMLRKKREMEEQFEAQKRELERRLREVEGQDDGGG